MGTASASVAVTVVNFNVRSQGNYNIAQWKTVNESDMDSYELEKSADGRSFEKAGVVTAWNGSLNEYSFTDLLPHHLVSFYRLKMKGKDGSSRYSNVIRLERSGNIEMVRLYPNQVKGHQFTLQLNLPGNRYTITVLNSVGQLVMQQESDHPGGASTSLMKLPMSVTPGTYVLLIKGGKINNIQRIIVE